MITPKFFRSYKKLILKFQTANSAHFDSIINFGVKKILGKATEEFHRKSSGSEISFMTDLENNGEDFWHLLINFNLSSCLKLSSTWSTSYNSQDNPTSVSSTDSCFVIRISASLS